MRRHAAGVVDEKRGVSPDLELRIGHELYTALERLDARPELLAILGSWGDGYDDTYVLEDLQRFNATGSIFETVDKRTDG